MAPTKTMTVLSMIQATLEPPEAPGLVSGFSIGFIWDLPFRSRFAQLMRLFGRVAHIPIYYSYSWVPQVSTLRPGNAKAVSVCGGPEGFNLDRSNLARRIMSKAGPAPSSRRGVPLVRCTSAQFDKLHSPIVHELHSSRLPLPPRPRWSESNPNRDDKHILFYPRRPCPPCSPTLFSRPRSERPRSEMRQARLSVCFQFRVCFP